MSSGLTTDCTFDSATVIDRGRIYVAGSPSTSFVSLTVHYNNYKTQASFSFLVLEIQETFVLKIEMVFMEKLSEVSGSTIWLLY